MTSLSAHAVLEFTAGIVDGGAIGLRLVATDDVEALRAGRGEARDYILTPEAAEQLAEALGQWATAARGPLPNVSN